MSFEDKCFVITVRLNTFAGEIGSLMSWISRELFTELLWNWILEYVGVISLVIRLLGHPNLLYWGLKNMIIVWYGYSS